MMQLPYLYLILSAFLLKVRCFANSEAENLFSLDDLEESGLMADSASSVPLLLNADSGDPSSLLAVIGSSNLFSEADSGNNDDSSAFLENDKSTSPFALTDPTLLSACATDQSLTDEQQPLLAARDDSSCSQPPAVPLSPDTLHLFEDPLGSLERAITPTNSDQSAPSPGVTPLVEPSYPGRLDPEEEQWRQRNPGGYYHNHDPVQGEYWHDYEGEVTHENEDDGYQHCQMYLALGYVYALCCRKVQIRLDPISLPEYYPMLEECDPNIGMSTF